MKKFISVMTAALLHSVAFASNHLSFTDLPQDIINHVHQYLKQKDWVNLALASKKTHESFHRALEGGCEPVIRGQKSLASMIVPRSGFWLPEEYIDVIPGTLELLRMETSVFVKPMYYGGVYTIPLSNQMFLLPLGEYQHLPDNQWVNRYNLTGRIMFRNSYGDSGILLLPETHVGILSQPSFEYEITRYFKRFVFLGYVNSNLPHLKKISIEYGEFKSRNDGNIQINTEDRVSHNSNIVHNYVYGLNEFLRLATQLQKLTLTLKSSYSVQDFAASLAVAPAGMRTVLKLDSNYELNSTYKPADDVVKWLTNLHILPNPSRIIISIEGNLFPLLQDVIKEGQVKTREQNIADIIASIGNIPQSIQLSCTLGFPCPDEFNKFKSRLSEVIESQIIRFMSHHLGANFNIEMTGHITSARDLSMINSMLSQIHHTSNLRFNLWSEEETGGYVNPLTGVEILGYVKLLTDKGNLIPEAKTTIALLSQRPCLDLRLYLPSLEYGDLNNQIQTKTFLDYLAVALANKTLNGGQVNLKILGGLTEHFSTDSPEIAAFLQEFMERIYPDRVVPTFMNPQVNAANIDGTNTDLPRVGNNNS